MKIKILKNGLVKDVNAHVARTLIKRGSAVEYVESVSNVVVDEPISDETILENDEPITEESKKRGRKAKTIE